METDAGWGRETRTEVKTETETETEMETKTVSDTDPPSHTHCCAMLAFHLGSGALCCRNPAAQVHRPCEPGRLGGFRRFGSPTITNGGKSVR